MPENPSIDYATLPVDELADLAKRGHREAFRNIMQRSNQRLFRIARGVLDDDAEAEDALQEAYINAFTKFDSYRGQAGFLTWMTRIVLNEAYGRLRRRRPTVDFERFEGSQSEERRVIPFSARPEFEDPAVQASRGQIRDLIEEAVDTLPEPFRIVFVMRDIEGCNTEETASALDIRAETVKTRLHRARRMLRAALHDRLSAALTGAFPFLGSRCTRMTETVLARLGF